MLMIVGIVVVVAGLVIGQLVVLVGAIRRPRRSYEPTGWSKAATIWLLLLAGWVGGIYYLVRIRPHLAGRAAQPPLASPLLDQQTDFGGIRPDPSVDQGWGNTPSRSGRQRPDDDYLFR